MSPGQARSASNPPVTFQQAFAYELERIRDSRAMRNPDATKPPQESLTGLAFSGGGIRSACFNLGVLQALAESRLLHKFDYLSTVSGGGASAFLSSARQIEIGGECGRIGPTPEQHHRVTD